MPYTVDDIARVIDADASVASDRIISELLLDSRRITSPETALFFALKGPRRDGHQFLAELYRKGVRAFVVSEAVDSVAYPDAVFLQVFDTLTALQQLTADHRRRFHFPVIGITGSNGKTVVKEWLFHLLQDRYKVVRSPRSYNSQIGVPLSVWQMNDTHTLGLFEAGISEQGEMLRLERIIRPTIGILTNIGEAHSDGFIDRDHKFREKLILARHCHTLIAREADLHGHEEALELFDSAIDCRTWGPSASNHFQVVSVDKRNQDTLIRIRIGHEEAAFEIPFTDEASIENAITCFCAALILQVPLPVLQEGMKTLHPVNMRMELKKGINHCTLINDSYSADLSSLEVALNFLARQSGATGRTLILSDLLHSSMPPGDLYAEVLERCRHYGVQRLIGIGPVISGILPELKLHDDPLLVECYSDTESFLRGFRSSQFRDETILVKGARSFSFEQIIPLLELQVHRTVLEINLGALVQNLKAYQQRLRPETKVMAMVKAFAYGSGGAEIAAKLQFHGVDYLGVAYADEGVELRKAGIGMPIMVMNPEEAAFEKIVAFRLEPELYSFEILKSFESFLRREGIEEYPVHIEVETGMNRLGFAATDALSLADALQRSGFRIRSVFSHLAASEDPAEDAFTRGQFDTFIAFCDLLAQRTGQTFLRHIANTAAVFRHTDLQLDMVRLGIGLYGIDPAASGIIPLQPVATLRSTIAQLKQVPAGGTIGYNRKGAVTRDSRIATIRLGYADGYPRRLGNGIGQVWIRGKKVPVIGNVCMDMFMADVTDLPDVTVGDEVILFGPELPVQDLATAAGTIPYEIMAGISQRVRRVYFEES